MISFYLGNSLIVSNIIKVGIFAVSERLDKIDEDAAEYRKQEGFAEAKELEKEVAAMMESKDSIPAHYGAGGSLNYSIGAGQKEGLIQLDSFLQVMEVCNFIIQKLWWT